MWRERGYDSLPRPGENATGCIGQRHLEAKRFGCREVDDQFKLDGRLNGKLARLLALEDAIDIGRASRNWSR